MPRLCHRASMYHCMTIWSGLLVYSIVLVCTFVYGRLAYDDFDQRRQYLYYSANFNKSSKNYIEGAILYLGNPQIADQVAKICDQFSATASFSWQFVVVSDQNDSASENLSHIYCPSCDSYLRNLQAGLKGISTMFPRYQWVLVTNENAFVNAAGLRTFVHSEKQSIKGNFFRASFQKFEYTQPITTKSPFFVSRRALRRIQSMTNLSSAARPSQRIRGWGSDPRFISESITTDDFASMFESGIDPCPQNFSLESGRNMLPIRLRDFVLWSFEVPITQAIPQIDSLKILIEQTIGYTASSNGVELCVLKRSILEE